MNLTSAEVPVIAPVKLSDGDTLGKVEGIDVWYCVYPKQGGRIPSELGNDQLLQVGRLLARLHNVGSTKTATSRVTIDPQSYGLNNLNYLLEAELIPEHISTQYCDLVREICELTQPWFKNLPVQRIHGDCHLGNLIWGSAGPFWVDFDDMLQGPPVQDLWLLVPGRDEYAQSQMRVLLEGYEQMRDFDHRTLKLIEPLRALRFIHFSAWIGMRWKDPAFPRVFPEYGTEKYWTEQVSDLQQQLRLIRERISAEEYL